MKPGISNFIMEYGRYAAIYICLPLLDITMGSIELIKNWIFIFTRIIHEKTIPPLVIHHKHRYLQYCQNHQDQFEDKSHGTEQLIADPLGHENNNHLEQKCIGHQPCTSVGDEIHHKEEFKTGKSIICVIISIWPHTNFTDW